MNYHSSKLLLLAIFLNSCQQMDFEPPYSNVTLNSEFNFHYKITNGQIIFLINTTMEGYVALGFGSKMR